MKSQRLILLLSAFMTDLFKQYITSKIAVSDDEFKQIIDLFTYRKLRKKQYFLQEGDVSNKIAFVLKGCLRLYRVDNKGNEHVVQFAFENWWMTDRESAMTLKPTMYNIDAIEDTEILVAPVEQMDGLRMKVPAFGDLMQQLQARNFVAVQKRINAALSYTAEEKYLELLHLQPEIIRRVPLNMVASYLGISRETLSRIRNKSM